MSNYILGSICLIAILILNVTTYYTYVRHRVTQKYQNPKSEWHLINNRHTTWTDILIWPLLDAYCSRRPYQIKMGVFELREINIIFAAWYNPELMEYTIRPGKICHNNYSYDDAIQRSNFFFDNNPALRLKYNRLLQLLQANKPENFEPNGTLKSHILNSSTPIENVS